MVLCYNHFPLHSDRKFANLKSKSSGGTLSLSFAANRLFLRLLVLSNKPTQIRDRWPHAASHIQGVFFNLFNFEILYPLQRSLLLILGIKDN